ncbi:Hypothetical protein GLP15_4233 [Giardia lamblia P15]|uniref:Uncharacterized protein n=1 Tax=Giardia intestinalis (strain P15) TaxID=658858 RepID=E1EY29_GIAIA|nr:Hypothetical protein GLP15_4233 [Giardia lamblia P15]
MDFFDDDLSPESELLDLEPDTQDYGEMTQETAQLLQRIYELPHPAISSPLSHFSSLYHSSSFLHNILSIYWLPSFLQAGTMNEISNHLLGQLRLMTCTRTGETRCGLLIKGVFPEKDVVPLALLNGSPIGNVFPIDRDFYDDSARDARAADFLGPADPFMDGIFRSLTLGRVQARELLPNERLSLLKYLLCFHFEDMAKAIMRNPELSDGQRDYVVRNILFPLLKCIVRSTPCYDTMINIIRALYTLPSVADTPIDQKLWGLLLFREVIFFQFCRCLAIFCNLTFKYDSEANVYCCIHSLFGGVVSKGVHTENYPPTLRCRCRYECTCLQDDDEHMEQIEQSIAHNASWNDCYTLSFHSNWSEKYGVETSRVVRAQNQIFHQEKKILSSLPELEDVLLNLIDVMVHYSISYCISPALCNALFILMGRIATDRTLHSAFLKEFGDILNLELTKTFYQRLDLTTKRLWEFQKPIRCQRCQQNNVKHDATIDITCCDMHRFLDPLVDTQISSEFIYSQSQLSNLVKPVTDYSYQNIESTIVSPKIQRAAILNMARILYVYTAKSGHSRSESLEKNNEIAYRQSSYVTFAEQEQSAMQDMTQSVSPHPTQHPQQTGALYTAYSAKCLPISLPPQHVISSTTQHSGETETETEYHEYLDYSGTNASSQSFSVTPYISGSGTDGCFSLRSYLCNDHQWLDSHAANITTPGLPSHSLPTNMAHLQTRKSKPFCLKNTEMKRYSQTNQSDSSRQAFVVATKGMQNDVIAFVRNRLYSKDNIPNLVFCAEALPLFCRAFTFRKRVKSLVFTFVKLVTSFVPAVQQNACRNLGFMLAGISNGCSISEEECIIIRENYLLRLLFNLFCNLLTLDPLSSVISLPLNLDKSSIDKDLLEYYESSKVSSKNGLIGIDRCVGRNPLLPQPFSSHHHIKPSKSMLTILIQGDDKDVHKQSSTSRSDTTDTDLASQSSSPSNNALDGNLSNITEEPVLENFNTEPSCTVIFAKDLVKGITTEQILENTAPANNSISLCSDCMPRTSTLELRSDKTSTCIVQSRTSLEAFSYFTENHVFHLKKLLKPSILCISQPIFKDIELSLLRTLPGVYATVACSHDYQNRIINIITNTLQSKASNQSTLHSLISALPDIYSNRNTTQENKELLLQCLESFLGSFQCTKDAKIVFLYSFTKYSMVKAETQRFLLRIVELVIKIYYDILQLPEEVHFHHGQVSAEIKATRPFGVFYLQCTPDLYVSITPVSFSSHTTLRGTGLYGFVDASEDSRSHCIFPELKYTEVDTKQWEFETSGPFYQYQCVDSPDIGYTFFVNSDWRYRCDVVETLVKIVAQFCTVFDTQAGFYLFSSVILHCIKDDCQTVSDCLVRLLGLELTPLLQKADREASIPLGILACALFGYTYQDYGVKYPVPGVSDREYSRVLYAKLCQYFLLPTLRHQKLGIRLLHHISRRVYKYDWFAHLFLVIILSIPNYDPSVQLSFVVSTFNLSKNKN